MPLSIIIKIFQNIKKLLNAQEFGLEIYSGEITRKKITKQELCFLHGTFLLDPIYVPTKLLSNYRTWYGRYGLHKISVSGDKST